MRDLYAKLPARIAAAREAGVPIYAGTDAGSMVAHGRIADEIDALKGIGMSATRRSVRRAGAPASGWAARVWHMEHRRISCASTMTRARAPASSMNRTW